MICRPQPKAKLNLTATDIKTLVVYDDKICNPPGGFMNQPKKEEPVYNENQIARQRLQQRIFDTAVNADLPLRQKFGLVETVPQNAKELIEAIQQKKYTLPSDDDSNAQFRKFYGIVWKDPKVEKNLEGFKETAKKLEKAMDNVQDEIFVLPPTDGLEAFRKFEAFVEKLIK